MAKNTIEHDGIVTQVADTFIIVTIQNQTACAGCHAKGACGMSEMALKSITAEKPNEEIKIGDKVIVSASTQNAIHCSFRFNYRYFDLAYPCRSQ